ncbi:MAG: hypothetical protein IJ725_03405 [Ruminococcus sp.]|nr:hypothetical protein [Ruminococcus sp.]
MKQLKLIAVLIIITFLFCGFASAVGAKVGTTELFYDTSGVYACTANDNSVTVKRLGTSSAYKYTYEKNVRSCCFTDGKLYAVTMDENAGEVIVFVSANGKLLKRIPFKTRYVTNNTKMRVDSSGRIYFLNHHKYVEAYNADGSYIGTISAACTSLIQVGDKVYAAGANGIFRLSGISEIRVSQNGISAAAYAVSSDCIAARNGALYSLKNGSKLASFDTKTTYSIASTKNYYMSLSGSVVNVYRKSNLKKINSFKLNYTPYGICAKGGYVFVISNSSDEVPVKKYSESYFLSSDSTKSDKTSSNSAKINFGSYKLRGKYIYLPPRVTRADFRSKISYEGYKLSFSTSRGLGTGTKAIFAKDSRSVTYTIIVKGDITGTGRITNKDVDIMFNCLFGTDKVSGIYKTAADMNGDGKLSNIDLVMLDKNHK